MIYFHFWETEYWILKMELDEIKYLYFFILPVVVVLFLSIPIGKKSKRIWENW
jgi:hypothetical protein